MFASNLNNRRTRRVVFFIILLVVFYSAYSVLKFPDPEFMKSDIGVKCELPNINPYDNSIVNYIFHPEPLRCFLKVDLTFFNKEGLLQLNITATKEAGFDFATLNCAYQAVYRTNDDDDHVAFKNPVSVQLPADIPEDFFLINCQDINRRTFTHLHAHVSKKTFKKITLPSHCPQTQYNVLVFGVDSVSRLNALRKLPKTYKYLTETLGGFVFKGYTKIGANTFPNMIPILTGKYESELHKTPMGNKFYDGYPLMWKNFSQCQYVTMFSEDAPLISIFNYLDKGFNEQPTDHYMRPFWLSFEHVHPIKDFLDPMWLALENKKVRMGKTSKLCYGGSPKYMLIVNYFLSFLRRYYHKMPLFAFSWLTEISHDYLNMVEVADNDFYEFLKVLNSEGFLNNSFLFFMSDHGHRFDWFRRTLIGRIEDKMPLFILKVPDKFKNDHPRIISNLQQNSEYLSSPFDTHETLKDILHANFESYPKTSRSNSQTLQPISLFQIMSSTRTCAQAGIPQQYCACYKVTDIDPKEAIVSDLTNYLLNTINTKTEKFRKICAEFRFSSILNIQKQVPSGSLKIKKNPILLGFELAYEDPLGLYIISMKVSPSGAIFEAMISVHHRNSMEILGDVNRINRYGNQSYCVNERILKYYCYCI